MVEALLKYWEEYIKSEEYEQEVARARKDRTEEDKESEIAKKVEVHRLRHQWRRCKKLAKEGHTIDNICAADQPVYERYLNGELAQDLDEATRRHGYGTLSTGEQIGAFGLTYIS